MVNDNALRRQKLKQFRNKKVKLKFDNLRLLEWHCELALQHIKRRQFDLIVANRKMTDLLVDLFRLKDAQ